MKHLLLLVSIAVFNSGYCQETTTKGNPVIFAEGIFGYGGSFGEYSGPLYGANANFQIKKNLFTVRYVKNPELKTKFVPIGMLAIPLLESKFENKEIALLYGRRFIKNSRSLSFSAGISTNEFEKEFWGENHFFRDVSRHVGLAYELSIKWFKSKKKRYRIYMLVPVGKPTAFGRSFGFKIVGNISKHSYMGFAITYGWGWHRKYSEN